MKYYTDAITGQRRRGPGRFFGRKTAGDSRFERACFWVGPGFHSWVYRVRCGLRGEWWR